MATRGLSGNRNEQGDFVTETNKEPDITDMLATKQSLLKRGALGVTDETKAKAAKFIDSFRNKNEEGSRSVIYKMLELNPNIVNHLSEEEIATGTFPSENTTKAFQDDMWGAYNAALQMLTDKLAEQNK
jgi:hypothetical protein